jgi:hypothetical protein
MHGKHQKRSRDRDQHEAEAEKPPTFSFAEEFDWSFRRPLGWIQHFISGFPLRTDRRNAWS